jgi:hypothetical protein
MINSYRTTRLTLLLLAGVTIAASLTLTGIACKTTRSGGFGVSAARDESAYRLVAFDHEQHQVAVDNECTTCHHEEPNAAETACHTCHDRREGNFSKKYAAFVPKLKEVMHNPDSGCRACHDETTEDGLWNCNQCHTR